MSLIPVRNLKSPCLKTSKSGGNRKKILEILPIFHLCRGMNKDAYIFYYLFFLLSFPLHYEFYH